MEILAQAMSLALGKGLDSARRGPSTQTTISTTTIHDNSVTVSGPIRVVSDDPRGVARELERRARQNALIQPTARR
jgi:hypothetical protein